MPLQKTHRRCKWTCYHLAHVGSDKLLNGFLISLEGLGEQVSVNATAEQRAGEGNCAGVRAPKCRYCNSRVLGVFVELEVHKSLGEQEYVSGLENFGKELVARVHEANLELTFQDKQELGGARVHVSWIDSSGSILQSGI